MGTHDVMSGDIFNSNPDRVFAIAYTAGHSVLRKRYPVALGLLKPGDVVTTYVRESRQVVDEDGVLQPADGDVAVDAYSGSASLAALEVRVADLERKTAGGCMSDDGCMCGHVCLCDGKA